MQAPLNQIVAHPSLITKIILAKIKGSPWHPVNPNTMGFLCYSFSLSIICWILSRWGWLLNCHCSWRRSTSSTYFSSPLAASCNFWVLVDSCLSEWRRNLILAKSSWKWLVIGVIKLSLNWLLNFFVFSVIVFTWIILKNHLKIVLIGVTRN